MAERATRQVLLSFDVVFARISFGAPSARCSAESWRRPVETEVKFRSLERGEMRYATLAVENVRLSEYGLGQARLEQEEARVGRSEKPSRRNQNTLSSLSLAP